MSSQSGAVNACAVIIGNEILSGRTLDKNLSFLGRRCDELGIHLREARVISDLESAIVETVNECRKKYHYVFTTGGIGPTHDDITALAVARAFGVELQRSSDAVAALRAHYPAGSLNEARLKMALVPAGASLLLNPVSAAPGFRMENVFVLPGVPLIMQAIFDGFAGELVGGAPLLTESVITGLLEEELAADLAVVQAAFPDIAIGSYPYFRQRSAGVNLILRGTDADSLIRCREAVLELISKLGGTVVA